MIRRKPVPNSHRNSTISPVPIATLSPELPAELAAPPKEALVAVAAVLTPALTPEEIIPPPSFHALPGYQPYPVYFEEEDVCEPQPVYQPQPEVQSQPVNQQLPVHQQHVAHEQKFLYQEQLGFQEQHIHQPRPLYQQQIVHEQQLLYQQHVVQEQQPLYQQQHEFQQQSFFQPQPIYQQQSIFQPQPVHQQLFYQPQPVNQPQPIYQSQPVHQQESLYQMNPVFSQQPFYQSQPARQQQAFYQQQQPVQQRQEQPIQQQQPVATDYNGPALSTTFSQNQTIGQTLYGAACCHCRKGIPARTPHKRCCFCRLDMCISCSNNHPTTHTSALKDVQYELPTNLHDKKRSSKEKCNRCNAAYNDRPRIRTRCQTCDWAVDAQCFANMRPDEHPHNSFVRVIAPSIGFTLEQNKTLPVCSEERHLDHCTKCSKAIPLLERFKTCRKCFDKWSQAGATCLDCGPPCSIHGNDHVVTAQLQLVSQADFAKLRGQIVKCDECTGWLANQKSLEDYCTLHEKHKACTIKVPETALEHAATRTARDCLLRPVRQDAPPAPSTEGMLCTICMNQFALSALSTCTTCLSQGRVTPVTVCATCKPLAKDLHSMHAPSPGQLPPFSSAADPLVITARAANKAKQQAEAAAEAARKKAKKSNTIGVLGLGLKVAGLAIN